MPKAPKRTSAPWLTWMAEYEGFPLALRVRPEADSAANRAKFTHLARITHHLAEVKRNGLPKDAYNESLAGFDHDVHVLAERDGDGLVVLVETFAGKRIYYTFVADEARLRSRFDELCAKYPNHTLGVEVGPAANWKFYSGYRKQFPW